MNVRMTCFQFTKQTVEGSGWTGEELALLAKAVARYPGGLTGRWEKISQMVGRSVKEVCYVRLAVLISRDHCTKTLVLNF